MKLERRVHWASPVRVWWLLLATVLAAVLWAIAQVLGWPVWARVVLAGLAAAVPLIVPELRAWFVQRETWAQLVDQRVKVSAGHGRLPRVRDVELKQLGVHPARVQVPFIKRDQQDKFEETIGPGRAALVVGHSLSGKTRLAAEVIKQEFPNALLLAAESGKSVQELFNGVLEPTGLVVWLDDLERFLGADGLTVGLLNRLTTGGAIVVATIRVEQRETYRPQEQLQRQPEWEVLQRFSEIPLQRLLTDSELDRVRAKVNDRDVLDAVDYYGLAEYLGAGPEALDKFEKGEDTNPVGHALMRAAIDWRRVGFTRPVSKQVLIATLPTYLADRQDVSRTNQTIDDGLVWATAKIYGAVALLGQIFTASNGPVYEAFDYLLDQLTSTGPPVPDPMWALALEQAEPDELIMIGLAADQADKQATAETAWRQAADEGDSEVALYAAVKLGNLLAQQGDDEGAKAAYQRAIASGHPFHAPWAALYLGLLLVGQDDPEGVKAAFQRALASDDAEVAPNAAILLGIELEGEGDLEGAKVAYQRAIDSGHPEVAPEAVSILGKVLLKQGDLEGAKAAFQRALAESVPSAAVNLGLVLEQQGHLEEAQALYQRAIDSGQADAASMGFYHLGLLLEQQGDLEGAKVAYQRVIASRDAEVVSRPQANDEEEEEEETASASRDAEVVSRAAFNLGALLEQQGDLEGAKVAYQRVIASGNFFAEVMPRAAVNLGLLLEQQGNLEEAKTAYQRAIASTLAIDDAEVVSRAEFNLGLLLEQQGDLEKAEVAYWEVIISGHSAWVPGAAFNLGVLYERQGDLEEAKTAYQRAIDSGHPEWAPKAASALEKLLKNTPPPTTS